MTKPGLHAIYGLYLPDQPAVILYVGSWCVATLDDRLRQHREGGCKTTSKCAARNGVETSDLRMRVLRHWMAGTEPNPEGEMTRGLQVHGQCRWNHPYALTTEDSRKGGLISGPINIRKMSRDDLARAGRIGGPIGMSKMSREDHARGGRKGVRKMMEIYGRTLEAHEMHLRVGRKIQELAKTPEGRELFARTGRIAGLKTQAGWGKTPEAQEVRIRNGHMNGLKLAQRGWHQSPEGQEHHVSAMHQRWHINRGIINPECELCKAAKP